MENLNLKDIPESHRFASIAPILKGKSGDKKYRIETTDGQRLLLRVSDLSEFERKKAEYGMMERAYAHSILTPQPLGFGLCNDNKSCYSLAGWLDGEDAETRMPHMREAEQYGFGQKAGAVLRKIHALPAPGNAVPWGKRFRAKVQKRIALYHQHNLICASGERVLEYLRKHESVTDGRAQTFWHGDFNVSNHIILENGEIGVLDYNFWNLDYGDPWWEFVIIPWGEEPPAHYFTGMIDGYFDHDPPGDFFKLLAHYFACDALSALCYTFLGEENVSPEDGRRHMENVLCWFDNLQNPVPTWYLKK